MKSPAFGKLPEAITQLTVANSPTPKPSAVLLQTRNSRVAGAVAVAGVNTAGVTLEPAAAPDAVTTPTLTTLFASVLTVTPAGSCTFTLIPDREIFEVRERELDSFSTALLGLMAKLAVMF